MSGEPDARADPGSDERVLKLREGEIATRTFDDEAIVLDLRLSTYLSTNPAGTVLWRELERGATRARLIQALLEEFEVSAERAAADVDAFVNDCSQRNLLDEGAPHGGGD
jgi:hypothetical protein